MSINEIISAINVKMHETENKMEGADSDDFLFCEEKISTFYTLSRELKMILFSTNGRTIEEFIPMLRGRVDAINMVIDLIRKSE